MNKRYLRKNDEGYYEYGLRLIEIKCKENPNDLDWEDILELLDYKIHRDSLRKACNTTMFSSYNVMQYYKDKYEVDNKKLKEIDVKIIELEEKKKQYQTVKLEYNKLLRQHSRANLYIEQIKDSIDKLKPLDIPNHKIHIVDNEKILLINISDTHVGRTGEIKGLHGEILNKYNFDIFKQRLWKIFDESLEIINKENINNVYLLCEGDAVDGLLRQSQIQSLELGVVDSVIAYCDFMSNYINELSKYVYVNYYSAYGNHDNLRLLSAKSDKEYPHENV